MLPNKLSTACTRAHLKILSSRSRVIFNSNNFALKFSDNAIAIHCRSAKLKFSAILLAFQIPSSSNQPFFFANSFSPPSLICRFCFHLAALSVLIDNLSEAVHPSGVCLVSSGTNIRWLQSRRQRSIWNLHQRKYQIFHRRPVAAAGSCL